MKRRIDYYFSMSSQWTYLGHDVFLDIARRHDLEVVFKPVLLRRLFLEIGAVPLAQLPPVRLKYRIIELQRWREFRGIPLKIEPKYWPFDATLVDTFIIAALTSGHNIDGFLRRVFAAIWTEDADLADPHVIAALAASVGLPAKLLEPDIQALANITYSQNCESAIKADVFGAPSYVLDGENFWGQDRLEMLDRALTSKRAAMTSFVNCD